jgi:hypothetical protein
MGALAAVEGFGAVGQPAIYDYVLRREQRFWEDQLKSMGLPLTLLKGVRQLMAVITSNRGAEDSVWCLRLIKELDMFEGEPTHVLDAIARMLHGCYPGQSQVEGERGDGTSSSPHGVWIEPLQPDPLGKFFVDRLLEEDKAFARKYADLIRKFGGQK